MSYLFNRAVVVANIVVLVQYSFCQSVPTCSNGIPESPHNTTQFLRNGESILDSIQVIVPGMNFTCNGTITGWTGWFTLNENFNVGQFMRMQVWRPTGDQQYYLIGSNTISIVAKGYTFYEYNQSIGDSQDWISIQPEDVIGFQIPVSAPTAATLLVSNNSDMTLYYTSTVLTPCNISLCDPKVSKFENMQPQVSPIIEILPQTTSTQSQPTCVNSPVTECSTRSVISTENFAFTSSTPIPTTTAEFPLAGAVAIPVSVILVMATAILVVTVILCALRYKQTKTKSLDIEHYEASTGDLYAAPRSRSGSVNTANQQQNGTTDLTDGKVQDWNDTTFVSRDEDTPPPLPPIAPLLTRLSSVSSNMSLTLSPQQKVFPAPRFNHSTLTLASPYMQPQMSPTKLIFRSRSTTLPRLDAGSRPSSAGRINQYRKHQRVDGFPYNVSPKKVTSPIVHRPQTLQHVHSMATMPLEEEPDSFDTQPHLNAVHQQLKNQAEQYMEPFKLQKTPLQLQDAAFPYADPVSISPVKESADTNIPGNIPTVSSSNALQRSRVFSGDNIASPYMEPSPVMKARHHSSEHLFRERAGTGSTVTSTAFVYIPPEDLNQAAVDLNLLHSPSSPEDGPICFHVPNYELRQELMEQDFDDNIYSRLRTSDCQAQPCRDNNQLFWSPSSSTAELYDQLASKYYREIPRKSIGVTDNIGSGHFGTVSKGVWQIRQGQQIEVAVKALKPDAPEEEEVKFLQEAAIMGQFLHPNIVQLHGVVTVEKPLMIVLELMSCGDLKRFLKRQRRRISDLNKNELSKLFLRFCRETACGMNYLAEKKFVHRDLAARNVLLADDLTCKIGDFGMARDLSNEVIDCHGGKIPLKWTAPEAVQYKKYTTASDIWSYGMVLYEIWTLGRKPFEKLDIKKLLSVIGTGICQSPPPGCPRRIYHLMVKCWNPYPNERPSFSRIMTEMSCSDDVLLWWSPQDEMVSVRCTELGAPLEDGENLYPDLRDMYKMDNLLSP